MHQPIALRPTLQFPYDHDRWQTLLQDLFPAGTLHMLQTPSLLEAAYEKVNRTRQLGILQLGDDSVALLEEPEARAVFQESYPTIAERLFGYEEELKNRTDQGKYFWELRSCDYWGDFLEKCIVFNETSKELHAYLDKDQNFINKTGFIILSEEPEFLLSVMNSKTMDWYFRSNFPSWGDPWKGGRVQFRGNLMK